MRFLTNTQSLFICFVFIISSFKINAQDKNNSIKDDPKFSQLLNEKRIINPSLYSNEQYKIQIYNGGSDNAKKTLNQFKQEFKNTEGTIIFNTPNYKVWVGNFKTRIETERHLIEIKKSFPNVFLIKPNK